MCFNVNTSPAVWTSLDARSIDQTRSQTNAPPQPDARYVVSSKQADGVFVMVDIRAETGSLESGGYRSGMYMYVSSVLKEVEAFFKTDGSFQPLTASKLLWQPQVLRKIWVTQWHPSCTPCLCSLSQQNGAIDGACVVVSYPVSTLDLSLSLSSVMGRIVLLRVYLEHRRSEVAIVSNQVSHRMWWDLST